MRHGVGPPVAAVGHGVWPLVTAEAMRALDRHTIEKLGVPGELLMECAGRVLADAALAELAPGAPVLAVCGPGNNGGDGLVAARHLHLRGVDVAVVLVADPGRLRGDAARNLERADRAGVPRAPVRFPLAAGAVAIDALLGTGLSRAPEGAVRAAIRRLNARPPGMRVVAADVPSGLDSDTGQTPGDCVRADRTVSFGLPKLGLALEPGRGQAGRVFVGRIGIADSAPGVDVPAELLTRRAAGALLPARSRAGHKGTFGHVLVVAASEGKTGAAALAAHGAARAGAGLVTVACPAGLNDILEVKCTEMMTAPVAETAGRALAVAAEAALLALAGERDAVALGPGIGRAEETLALVRSLVPRLAVPLVLDADGLVAFAGEPKALRRRRGPAVLTPHPGEAGALLGCSAADVNADRPGAARRLAEASGAVVVLKGAATVIAEPGGRVRINPTGGPVLATGGTGDVLTGVVAALLASGQEPFDAASTAVFLHGLAGDRVALADGPAGALAEDVARELPRAVEALRAAARAPAPAPGEASDAMAFPEPG